MSLLYGIYNDESVHIEEYDVAMGGKVSCGACGGRLIAKRGVKNAHHFCHKAVCTVFASSTEPMTPWHRDWQTQCIQGHAEVTVHRTYFERKVMCRADIVKKDGVVIEIQHNNIVPSDMAKREHCHSNMIWIVDGVTPTEDGQLPVELLFTCHTENGEPLVAVEVKRSALNFVFRATKLVYFETQFGMIKLLRRLTGATFMGRFEPYMSFMAKYFDGILVAGSKRMPSYEKFGAGAFRDLIYNPADITVRAAHEGVSTYGFRSHMEASGFCWIKALKLYRHRSSSLAIPPPPPKQSEGWAEKEEIKAEDGGHGIAKKERPPPVFQVQTSDERTSTKEQVTEEIPEFRRDIQNFFRMKSEEVFAVYARLGVHLRDEKEYLQRARALKRPKLGARGA